MIIKHLCSQCSNFAEVRIRAICLTLTNNGYIRDERATNDQPWQYLCRPHFNNTRGTFSMEIDEFDFNERLR